MALDIQAGDDSAQDLVRTVGALLPESQLKKSHTMRCFMSVRLPKSMDVKVHVQCMGEHWQGILASSTYPFSDMDAFFVTTLLDSLPLLWAVFVENVSDDLSMVLLSCGVSPHLLLVHTMSFCVPCLLCH